MSLTSATVVKLQNPLKRKRQNEISQQNLVCMATHNKLHKHEHTEPSLPPPPPSWAVICLLGLYMNPETLAVASCVSTTWLNCFSSDDLWQSLLTTQSSQPFYLFEKLVEGVSYKKIVTTIELDAKRRRKNQLPEPKISLSDLNFFVHVSTTTKKSSVNIKGKDLVFISNDDKFLIEVDVSNSGISFGEKDVKMTWQVVYGIWKKFFTMADTTSSLHTKYGWFTESLEVKDDRKILGDVKTSFKGDLLEKVGFSIVDSNWGSLSVNNVLRYLERFLVEQ